MSFRQSLTRWAQRISPYNLYTQDQLDSNLVQALGEKDLVDALESDFGGKAFNLATTYACVRIISTSIAGMPWVAEELDDVTKGVLAKNPWRFMNPIIFREWLVAATLMRGNAYAIIHRDASDKRVVTGIEPIMKGSVKPAWDDSPGRRGYLKYTISRQSAGNMLKAKTYLAEDVLDFSGFCPNELGVARSVIQVAATPYLIEKGIGLFARALFNKGALFRGFFRALNKAGEEELKEMKQKLIDYFKAEGGSGTPPMIPAGIEYIPIQIAASDLQLMQIKDIQTHDILRAFGVPAQMISLSVKNTNPGDLGRVLTAFSRFTIQPVVHRIAAELNAKLVPPSSDAEITIDFSELEKATMGERVQMMTKVVGGSSTSGILTINEAREWLGYPKSTDPKADKLVIWEYRGGKSGDSGKPKPKDDDGEMGDEGDGEAE